MLQPTEVMRSQRWGHAPPLGAPHCAHESAGFQTVTDSGRWALWACCPKWRASCGGRQIWHCKHFSGTTESHGKPVPRVPEARPGPPPALPLSGGRWPRGPCLLSSVSWAVSRLHSCLPVLQPEYACVLLSLFLSLVQTRGY